MVDTLFSFGMKWQSGKSQSIPENYQNKSIFKLLITRELLKNCFDFNQIKQIVNSISFQDLMEKIVYLIKLFYSSYQIRVTWRIFEVDIIWQKEKKDSLKYELIKHKSKPQMYTC